MQHWYHRLVALRQVSGRMAPVVCVMTRGTVCVYWGRVSQKTGNNARESGGELGEGTDMPETIEVTRLRERLRITARCKEELQK